MVGLTHCKNISMLLMMDKLNLELVTFSNKAVVYGYANLFLVWCHVWRWL